MVEYDGFRRFAASLNPYFKMISRTTARNDCISAFNEQKSVLKEMFKGATCRFSLTADMWTSNQTMGYMCVTCHFIDVDWKIHKRIIKFFRVKTPHTGFEMFNTMLSCIQDWNIADKIFSVTLDNASANDAMVALLKCNLKTKNAIPSRGKLLHNRCAAHVINLIAKDGLKVVDSIVSNIRETVKYIDGSQSRKQKFEEIVAQQGITCQKHPNIDVRTRWNSTYLMLEASFPFMSAFESLAGQDKNYKYAPSINEWERASIVCRILKVLYEATLVVSGSLYPTSNLYFHEMWKIKMILERERSNSDNEVAAMVKKMKEKFDKYWLKSYKYLCIPVIFDPRFKFKFVEFCLGQAFGKGAKDRIEKVRKRLNLLFKDYSDDSNTNSNLQAHHVMAIPENDPLADWVYHITEELNDQIDTELDVYLKEKPIHEFGRDFDILNWWKANYSKYPTLAHIARDVLAWPASMVASVSESSI
ncbi:zinc finger BED domain-containing protein RICESLEEPER 2-like [Oryza brachyantha]|uniref:zinc finger BED domain-containing protein RICESLEEPER 2-like n=1 Tax=Oryza brachyantha TaxID=4533 RepID=UPI001ADA68E9|nr:zinc finger BED domain-containing protein RICESLEEPER 2-like [Oryza brachyantha]